MLHKMSRPSAEAILSYLLHFEINDRATRVESWGIRPRTVRLFSELGVETYSDLRRIGVPGLLSKKGLGLVTILDIIDQLDYCVRGMECGPIRVPYSGQGEVGREI